MESLINQAVQLLNELNDEKLKKIISLIQVIQSDGELVIHNRKYTNIPDLKYTLDHKNLGPREDCSDVETILTQGTIPDLKDHNLGLNKITPSYIFDESILTRGTKFNPKHFKNCVFKNSDVLIHGGSQVIYEDYVFWSEYNGTVSFLYFTKEDYEKYKDNRFVDDDAGNDAYDQFQVEKHKNSFTVATRDLLKIIPIENLDYELEQYRLRHGCYDYES